MANRDLNRIIKELTDGQNPSSATFDSLTVDTSLSIGGQTFNYTLLDEATVTGAAATTISFTGLDINTHKGYLLELLNINAGTACAINLFINSDTTITNYYTQRNVINGATTTPSRINDTRFGYSTPANGEAFIIGEVRLINGYASWESSGYRDMSSGFTIVQESAAKTSATVSNITQIDLSTSTASQFAVGTIARIYRRDI